MKETFKLGDRILNKIADVLLSRLTEDDYKIEIVVKAKKGVENDENG